MTSDGFDEAEARAEIQAALLSYTRGIDRLDASAVSAGFHPGATLDYGSGERTIEDFAAYAVEALGQGYVATQHRMSNTAVEFAGDVARVETYVLAFHVEVTDDSRFLHTFNGRYIDTFERRDAGWKIARRVLRCDWTNREPMPGEMRGSFLASDRDRTDPLYEPIIRSESSGTGG
jgi:hypothetical protein